MVIIKQKEPLYRTNYHHPHFSGNFPLQLSSVICSQKYHLGLGITQNLVYGPNSVTVTQSLATNNVKGLEETKSTHPNHGKSTDSLSLLNTINH